MCFICACMHACSYISFMCSPYITYIWRTHEVAVHVGLLSDRSLTAMYIFASYLFPYTFYVNAYLPF